jgi:antitoxin component of MazEF toxin-antitoxin module
MQRKPIRIGNAVGVTLPSEVLARYNLSLGEAVEVVATDDHIEIAPRRTVAEILDSWERLATHVPLEEIVRIIREDRESR